MKNNNEIAEVATHLCRAQLRDVEPVLRIVEKYNQQGVDAPNAIRNIISLLQVRGAYKYKLMRFWHPLVSASYMA